MKLTRNWRGNEVGSFRCGGRISADQLGYTAEAWAGTEWRTETFKQRLILTEGGARRAVERWLNKQSRTTSRKGSR